MKNTKQSAQPDLKTDPASIIPEGLKPKDDKPVPLPGPADVFSLPSVPEEKKSWRGQIPHVRKHYYLRQNTYDRLKEAKKEYKVATMSKFLDLLAEFALNILDSNKKKEIKKK